MSIPAIEQNYQYLGFGALTGVSSGSKAHQVQRTSGGPQQWGAAAANVQDGELTPDVGMSGNSYTNGLGHSQHTKNWMM